MTLEEVTRQVKKSGKTKEDQIRILRKSRLQLLDEIHSKQQLDYMIHEIKKDSEVSIKNWRKDL